MYAPFSGVGGDVLGIIREPVGGMFVGDLVRTPDEGGGHLLPIEFVYLRSKIFWVYLMKCEKISR